MPILWIEGIRNSFLFLSSYGKAVIFELKNKNHDRFYLTVIASAFKNTLECSCFGSDKIQVTLSSVLQKSQGDSQSTFSSCWGS